VLVHGGHEKIKGSNHGTLLIPLIRKKREEVEGVLECYMSSWFAIPNNGRRGRSQIKKQEIRHRRYA